MEYLTEKRYNNTYFKIYKENDVIYITFESLFDLLRDLLQNKKKRKDVNFDEQIRYISTRYDCKIYDKTYEDSRYNTQYKVVSIHEVIDLIGDHKVSRKISNFLLWLSNLPMLLRKT